MKKLMNVFMIAMLATVIVFTGCKDDDDDPAPVEKGNFATLSEYMVNNDLDLPTLLGTPSKWVVAPELISKGGIVDPTDHSIPGYHVFDIRSAEHFAQGHIKDAINVALTDVLTKAAEVGTDKPILMVCYSGQTAGRATMALRLSGFADAQVMKFGMSYWHTDFDKWTAKISDVADGNSNWEIDVASPGLPLNDFPAWETTSTDGATILADAVTAMLSVSDWGNQSADILADPLAHNIYNYWDEATYMSIGHYKGAYLNSVISLENDLVSNFPQEDEFNVYCYTGQTSSFAVAWLHVLGYNAQSIYYGVNSLRHTALDEAGKPAWHHSKDYPYVASK